jgi:Pyruvate/2-oxoacid:ferredoxin oxidoreductase gamma subunit
MIEASLDQMPAVDGYSDLNARKEYGRHYREEAIRLKPVPAPARIEAQFIPPEAGRNEIVILGSAGQRIVTAGEILCLAGITAGLHASQKNDYPITVLRGHSVSELIVSEEEIGYTGTDTPSVVIALAPEGVNRRRAMFAHLPRETLVIKMKGIDLPPCDNDIIEVDFKTNKIKTQDWAMASLALLVSKNKVLNMDMLKTALGIRFRGAVHEEVLALVEKVATEFPS